MLTVTRVEYSRLKTCQTQKTVLRVGPRKFRKNLKVSEISHLYILSYWQHLEPGLQSLLRYLFDDTHLPLLELLVVIIREL